MAHGADHRTAAVAATARRLARFQEALVLQLEDFSSEPRTARRDARLRRFFRAVTHYGTGAAAATAAMDIRTACLFSLRNGPPAEQYAACRVLEATCVVLGATDDEEWYDSLRLPLERVVSAAHRATPVRMVALRALAMAAFMGADTVTTESLMDLCEVFSAPQFREHDTNVALRATALDCWALLASTSKWICPVFACVKR
jgi:hypothetical protein